MSAIVPAHAARPLGMVSYAVQGEHVVICWQGNNCRVFGHANVHNTGYDYACNDDWQRQVLWNYSAEKVALISDQDLPKSIGALHEMVANDSDKEANGFQYGTGYAEFHDCGVPLGGLLQGALLLDIETPDEDTDGFDGWFYVTEIRQ